MTGINMKKSNSLSDFSFYMITRNGHNRLLITLKFLKNNSFDGHLVVVDGSQSDKFYLYKKFQFVEYIHKPGCLAPEGLMIASSKIKTKYAAFIGDDDLPILSGVRQALKFLKQNSEYDAAYGNAGFVLFDELIKFNKLNLLDRFKFAMKTLLSDNYTNNVRLDYSDPLARLKSIQKKYIVSQFFISRTEFIQRIYNANYNNINDVHVSEYGFSFVHAAICKTKKLNCTYLLRGIGAYRPNANPESQQHKIKNRNKMEQEIKKFVMSCDLEKSYQSFVEQLIKEKRYEAEEIRLGNLSKNKRRFEYIIHQIKRLKFILIGQSIERTNLAFRGYDI